MGKVHCAFPVIPFSAVSVNVAVIDYYRHEVMLLATKHQYWLSFPLVKGSCQLH